MNQHALTQLITLLDQLLTQGYLTNTDWGSAELGQDFYEDLQAQMLIEQDLKGRWQFRPLNHRALLQEKQQLEEQLENLTNSQIKSTATPKRKGSDHKYYLLNARKPCEWFHLDNPEQSFDLFTACQFSGPISLTFHPEDDLACDQPLALIENIEVLHHPASMAGHKHFGCNLFYHGNLSNSFLKWLTTRRRTPELWIFPEYDYVGLTNYLRLKELLPDIQLFVPDDLEQRMGEAQQTSPQRPEDQHKHIHLKRLQNSDDPHVQRVMATLEETGTGLSQEALLDF